jgi:hypothetical protein
VPQPFEEGEVIGRMRVVESVRRGYRCVCIRCTRDGVVAARSLRIKHGVDCARCFPPRRQPSPVVVYSRPGYAYLTEAE